MPSRRIASGLVVSLVLLGACSDLTYVGRAKTAYEDGRYLEVAEALARREPELDRLPNSQRARYGLYRGLALIQLGDPEEGRRWLHYARDLELSEATLSERQRQQLSAGLSGLNRP